MVMSIVLTALSSTGRPAIAWSFPIAARCQSHRATNSVLQMSILNDFNTNIQRTFSSLSSKPSKYYTVGITGASGLIGSALINELQSMQTLNGKPIRVVAFSRSNNVHDTQIPWNKNDQDSNSILPINLPWNPNASDNTNVLPTDTVQHLDALIHLAGENVATGLGPLGFLGIRPWTAEKKQAILSSRVGPTKLLAQAVQANPSLNFIVASGVGVYGNDYFMSNDDNDNDDVEAADESTNVAATTGFLATVSREWEAAATVQQNNKSKNRIVQCRMGVVLSTKGGALAKLIPIFWLGGGGIVGSGRQYFSFISARDAARALVYILTNPSRLEDGPVNVCAPVPCTNAEFTAALGRVLMRPTILPLPGFVVSLLFGEMGEEMLLGGVKAVPTKLEKSGFVFQHKTILEALQSAMSETI